MYDTFFPYETSQKPLFELLGTPLEHKVHKTYPTEHMIIGAPGDEARDDILEWLDKYLGPAGGKQDAIVTDGDRK
jgi:hypothetical protein